MLADAMIVRDLKSWTRISKKIDERIDIRLFIIRLRQTFKEGSMSEDKWEFYVDNNGKWRWRRVASNGRITGASCQGYANKADCIDNAIRNGYAG